MLRILGLLCGFIEFLGLAFSGTNLEFSRDWNIRWTSLVAQKIGLSEYFEVCISGNFWRLVRFLIFSTIRLVSLRSTFAKSEFSTSTIAIDL